MRQAAITPSLAAFLGLINSFSEIFDSSRYDKSVNTISTTKTQNSGAWESTPLSGWGLILVEGPDSEQFLQNQLTNTVLGMQSVKDTEVAQGNNQVRLVGYCSPKGRLLASAWLALQTYPVESSEVKRYYLFISKDIAGSTAKRLGMYVLRSKVKVTDVSDHWMIEGKLNQDAQAQYLSASDEIALQLPELGVESRNTQRIVSAKPKQAHYDATHSEVLEIWNDLEVISGIPRIVLATQEQFVPQMINFESVDGVDFKKGCYPGQEIVARSQYRGVIKRRLHLAHFLSGDADVIHCGPATELFHASDPNQPAGMVVLSAKNPSNPNRIDLQVELKLEALEKGEIHLGGADGPVLKIDPLPYPLIEI
ncbi:folate-binding protein YgfZ [Polynucleobacter paneuropaeus]|uniref:Folate-binding protein n=1 Tax=Polynucleobacter paneuropaeus TaxID=2527775 RepID=A0A2Z4JT13_9BURK|nr:folate-binding protein [Polynucleobacter paneuropaeus]